MKIKYFAALILIGLTLSILSAMPASATFFNTEGGKALRDYFNFTSVKAGYYIADPKYGLQIAMASVIRYALAMMGTVFLILVLYGGFTWMSAQGNEEKVTKARGIIINATIGLIVIITAFSLSTYILENLINAVEGRGLVTN